MACLVGSLSLCLNLHIFSYLVIEVYNDIQYSTYYTANIRNEARERTPNCDTNVLASKRETGYSNCGAQSAQRLSRKKHLLCKIMSCAFSSERSSWAPVPALGIGAPRHNRANALAPLLAQFVVVHSWLQCRPPCQRSHTASPFVKALTALAHC